MCVSTTVVTTLGHPALVIVGVDILVPRVPPVAVATHVPQVADLVATADPGPPDTDLTLAVQPLSGGIHQYNLGVDI